MTPSPTKTRRGHTTERSPEDYAKAVEAYFEKTLANLRALYERCPPDTQDLLKTRPAVIRVIA